MMPISFISWVDECPGVISGSKSKAVSKGMWFWIFSPKINLFKWTIKIVGVRV